MSKELFDAAVEFRTEYLSRLRYLTEAIPVIVPQTKEDAQKIRVGMDMLAMLGDQLVKAETLGEFGRILDLDELEDRWDDTKALLESKAAEIVRSESYRLGNILDGDNT